MPDISTVELARTRMKLRSDLLFVPQVYGGQMFCHIEVKSTSEYFRIGYPEYVFVSLLDGRTSFSEALAIASQQLRENALSQGQALEIYTWLLDNGLGSFHGGDAGSAAASSSGSRSTQPGALARKLNPLWLKLPLGRPDAFLTALTPSLGWIFSVPATIVVGLLMAVAGVTLMSQWRAFTVSSAGVISQDNWFWLLVAWMGLKVFHELGHGLVCRRYGGSIREAGVIFAFFAPLAYIDASSSWSFRSRWHRMHTALAGVWMELLIASAAVLVWTQVESVFVRHLLQNVIVMASLSTLMFNLNPLMRFDGYYVLSDLMQTPNLSTQSSSILLDTTKRVLTGGATSLPSITGTQRWMLLTYGAAAAVWRILVSLSLLIMASVMFHGAGLSLAVLAAVVWFGRPLWKSLNSAHRLWQLHPERLFRASLICLFVGVIVVGGLIGLPSPVMTTAPGIVDFTDGEIVRASTAGFVDAIHVMNGQPVSAGDLLISLRNDEVSAKLKDLEKQVSQEDLRIQTASAEHNMGALNVSQVNRQSLSQQLLEYRKHADGLQIRAGRNGQVIARSLESLRGTFAGAGIELLTIGMNNRKEVQLSIGQRELAVSSTLVGHPVKVRIGTHAPVTGTLVRVNPRGSRKIPHAALAASNGGPLTVAADTDAAQDSAEHLRLTEHRFTAIVELPENRAKEFCSGERGVVALGLPGGSLGYTLWRATYDWFEKQLAAVKQSSSSKANSAI